MFIYEQNFVYIEFYAFHYKCIPPQKKNMGLKVKKNLSWNSHLHRLFIKMQTQILNLR